MAQTTWVLNTEFGYRRLPGSEALRSFYCDFSGKKKYGQGSVRLTLETKYLKRPIDSIAKHLAADVIRLSLPRPSGLARIFLLAGRSKNFESAKKNFLFDRMFRLPKGKGCDLKFDSAILSPDFLKSYLIYEKPIELTDGNFVRARSAYVQCRSIERFPEADDGFKVVIWSVAPARLESVPESLRLAT